MLTPVTRYGTVRLYQNISAETLKKKIYKNVNVREQKQDVAVLPCYLRCCSVRNAAASEPWGRGKQEGKVEAAAGGVQQQCSERRSPPRKRGSKREGSRSLWEPWWLGGQHVWVAVLAETPHR